MSRSGLLRRLFELRVFVSTDGFAIFRHVVPNRSMRYLRVHYGPSSVERADCNKQVVVRIVCRLH